MIGGSVAERSVAVLTGEGQGSGVLLNAKVVLTALHVVAGSSVVHVIHPGGTTAVKYHVAWSDDGLDAALLFTQESVKEGRPTRLGRLATRTPLPHCEIVGLPDIQRYGDRHENLEYDHFRVSVLPMAGRVRRVLVCELDVPAADEGDRRSSPLEGLSGAPVFAGGVLLGVVTQVPRGRRHHRIEAVTVESVVAKARYDGKWFATVPVEEITEVHPRDELFEQRYARDLSAEYRKTEIFGIEELGRSESRWDLDTAYLSLQAETPWSTMPGENGLHMPAQRVESLLAKRPRALLRGQAGAGKTTLVWWLAAHAANGTLSEELAELNGLVPFVVTLREVYRQGGRFPSVSELLSSGQVITDDAPEGWARRVLDAGRGLLLVDGLDEVPPEEREKARRWLARFLGGYSDTRCLATVRPDAVERNWLRPEGFEELTLLPMSDGDVTAFVTAWHDAARLECEHVHGAQRGAGERELLTSLEQDLIHQLGQNAALRDLARTPLLCAVICALHRRRRGLLPTTRWSLYRAALAMLLGGRDAGRGVARTSDVTLDSEEQHALLQRLAIWLVRTGQQQMTGEEAVAQLDRALRDMPQTRSQGPADRVLRFLLDRSGLLQERTDDAIQFVHRTFQDFLAAKEFHESGYILELLPHAEDETWRDVIVLAVGHATRMDAHRLVEKLVKAGDGIEGRKRRWYLHLLATQCATSLMSLDAGLMEVVKGRMRALLPPRTFLEAQEIAGLGAQAVELLSGPEELSDEEAALTTAALCQIRTVDARRKLRQFTSHPSSAVHHEIAAGWLSQPTEAYAREVLAGARLRTLFIRDHAHLAQLSRVGSVQSIMLDGGMPAEELGTHLPTRNIEKMEISNNGMLTHLDFLRDQQDLTHLGVASCPSLRDFSGLSGLRLQSLFLATDRDMATLQPPPGVRHLRVTSGRGDWFRNSDDWLSLEKLEAYGSVQATSKVLRAAPHMPWLTHLGLMTRALHQLMRDMVIPNIRKLTLTEQPDAITTARLRRTFPNLEELYLEMPGGDGASLPSATRQDLSGLRFYINGRLQP
ncbi:NACHT domain-containing protein [Streptomyces sp. NPDC057257]|uniref:NACHT domain-containing protein n=1 Tax=Streptomyces sp. NPDC057257 TaxID=3346071 RepID=UPI0036406202